MKSMGNVLLKKSAIFVSVAAVAVFALTQSASATVIAYDGFSAGGVADGRASNATSYTTSPASTNGWNYDSLHTQSPISTGFADDDAWNATNDVVTAMVYFQSQLGGLQYANFEPNMAGQARFFRSSYGDSSKIVMRDAVTTDISDIQWVAMLVYFNSAPSTSNWYHDFVVTLEYGESSYSGGDGAWTPATFGVSASDGKGFYRTDTGGSKVDVETAEALSAGTHLFLLKFDHGSSVDARYDDVTLWVDPVLTADSDELTGGLAAVSIMRAHAVTKVMHAFDELNISASVKRGNEIVFDEFIITDDYQDLVNFDFEVTNTFQTADATYIRSGSVNNNFNDDGQIIVGHTYNDVLRGLIEFDLNSIPALDQITSVSLELSTDSEENGINQVGGTYTVFNLYEYESDIDETSATWNAPDADASDVAGGSSGTLLSSTSFNVVTRGQSITFNDSPALRAAVLDAMADDGFLRLILRGADETLGLHNFARFSDETVSPVANRPELRVSYRPLPPQGKVILIQ